MSAVAAVETKTRKRAAARPNAKRGGTKGAITWSEAGPMIEQLGMDVYRLDGGVWCA